VFEIPVDLVEPGTYKASLEKVEVLPSANPNYPGDFRKWHFLVDVRGSLTAITATSSMNNGPKTKTYKWLKALLRRELRSGERIESPVGQQVLVVIENNEKGYPSIVELLPIAEAPEQVLQGVPR